MVRLRLNSFDDDKDKLTTSLSMRRQNTFTLAHISAAEVTDLMQKTANKVTVWQTLKPYLSLILW
jgi:hypothetical protein